MTKAQAALDSGWKKLWGVEWWMAESVMEYDDDRKAALSSGTAFDFGSVSPLCVEKEAQ